MAIEPSETKDIPNLLRGEQALWRAVITQALMDAASQSTKMEACYEKRQATCWLTGFGEDFKTVCDLANFPPDYVRERAAQALARNCQWRNTSHYPSKALPTEQGEARSVGFGEYSPTHEMQGV